MAYTRDCTALRKTPQTKPPIVLRVTLPSPRRRPTRDNEARAAAVARIASATERDETYQKKVAPLVAAEIERTNRQAAARSRCIADTARHVARWAQIKAQIDASNARRGRK